MYFFKWDKQTGGYLLTNHTGRYVANEIRPVFADELEITGLDKYFEYDRHETLPLMWAQKNTYLIADTDEKGNSKAKEVLLDICHRVLLITVSVIFSDTDMELPDTYRVWEEIKGRYPKRDFICAKAESGILL